MNALFYHLKHTLYFKRFLTRNKAKDLKKLVLLSFVQIRTPYRRLVTK